MCVTHSRNSGLASAEATATFASAAVISTLTMADWQVSQDVDAAMRSAVDALAGAVLRAGVVVHRDSIDVWASAADGRTARRRCFPRQPFRTAVDCDVPVGTVDVR